MNHLLPLVEPHVRPPLDDEFRPAALANRAFRAGVEAAGGGVPLVLALERSNGALSRYQTYVYDEGDRRAAANLAYVERLVKFLLWQRGGWRLFVAGPASIAAYIRQVYAPDGPRRFDFQFMGQQVYDQPFTVVACTVEEAPQALEVGMPLGGRLDGYRIGFDLGASDLKVSAVVDGEAIFSEEIVWEPVEQSDPAYHYERIRAALRLARAALPRLDAIGGSSAGVFVDNQPRVASLFRGIPAERYGEVRSMFQRLAGEFGVPLEVVNDGDVTALAGAMSLDDTGVLGIAMGSSEAAGYVDHAGKIMGWLNELAFAPVDYSPNAPVGEWSGDRGVGALYFSQQAVFRLAPLVGIELPADATKAGKLKHVQQLLEDGHTGALDIWRTIGVYLGYGLAHYADFYAIKHALILGRVTSGRGGSIILDEAQKVLARFPELSGQLNIQLPDEKSRRVGQSIAAASLPVVFTGDSA
jgi:predicted NBD/HSP70 family sugar kinase